jgi:hypothetical protein
MIQAIMRSTTSPFHFPHPFLAGSTALQLSPVLPGTDFVDASEVKNLIQSKDYFKWSTNPWNHALDSIMHQDISLCALGGLIGHLSRLMVCLPVNLLCSLLWLAF